MVGVAVVVMTAFHEATLDELNQVVSQSFEKLLFGDSQLPECSRQHGWDLMGRHSLLRGTFQSSSNSLTGYLLGGF